MIFSAIRDASERKKAEKAVRITANAFELHVAVLVTDVNANIIRVNRAFEEITGYSKEDVLGKNPRVFGSGKHSRQFYEQMWHELQTIGVWSGELWDKHKNGHLFPAHVAVYAVKDSQGKTTEYVAVFSDISERKRVESEIHQLAFYDTLTGLPNRRLLMDRLDVALSVSSRTKFHGALLFLDLDNFKTLNDTLGHAMGDLLLKHTAARLKSCVREGDTVARFGGDEFVIMLEDLNERVFEAAEQAQAIGEKILESMNGPYLLEARSHLASCSIGITLFHGKGQAVGELLKQADIAMYQAKKAGRRSMRFFDAGMQEAVNSRASLEDELRTALAREQFQLYFQVQMGADGHPTGAEALIRWNHPERGIVYPGEFIPLAEECGVIVALGEWVLDAGCRELREWAEDPLLCDLVVSLNISAQQLHQPGFVVKVKEALARHSANPARLKLELTESVSLQDTEETLRKMCQLRELGITFSLDDFGTGYCSLRYLRRLPLDSLKIDQSFVRDIERDSNAMYIVRSIIALAHSLELNVIAEGVETEQQKQLLEGIGCLNYQGYLFGRPEPVERLHKRLKESRPRPRRSPSLTVAAERKRDRRCCAGLEVMACSDASHAVERKLGLIAAPNGALPDAGQPFPWVHASRVEEDVA